MVDIASPTVMLPSKAYSRVIESDKVVLGAVGSASIVVPYMALVRSKGFRFCHVHQTRSICAWCA